MPIRADICHGAVDSDDRHLGAAYGSAKRADVSFEAREGSQDRRPFFRAKQNISCVTGCPRRRIHEIAAEILLRSTQRADMCGDRLAVYSRVCDNLVEVFIYHCLGENRKLMERTVSQSGVKLPIER